jgi:hypothetical protein
VGKWLGVKHDLRDSLAKPKKYVWQGDEGQMNLFVCFAVKILTLLI